MNTLEHKRQRTLTAALNLSDEIKALLEEEKTNRRGNTGDCILNAVNGFFGHGFTDNHVKPFEDFIFNKMEVLKVTDVNDLTIDTANLLDMFVYTQSKDEPPRRGVAASKWHNNGACPILDAVEARTDTHTRRLAIFLTYGDSEEDAKYTNVLCCELVPSKAITKHQ